MSVTATDYSGQVWLSLFNDTVRTYTFQLIFYHFVIISLMLIYFFLCISFQLFFVVFRIILIFIIITLLCYYDYFDFFLLNISWFSSFLISQFLTYLMSFFSFWFYFSLFSCWYYFSQTVSPTAQAIKVLGGYTADQLYDMKISGDEQQYEQICSDALFKTHLFRVRK